MRADFLPALADCSLTPTTHLARPSPPPTAPFGTPAGIVLVEYGSASLRERLADLSAGSVVSLELSRAGGRANVWRADVADPAGADSTGAHRSTDATAEHRAVHTEG